ncbi:MAG: twin-arginine translocase TatA/TatE family subunit [Rhizomicrobium sp.]
MGAFSIWHIIILAVIVLLLFGGRGKISDLMGDVAKGIKSFRQGLNDPEDAKTIQGQPADPLSPIAPNPNKDQTTVGR